MARLRLFRLSDRNESLTSWPWAPPAEVCRCHSPPSGSTLITSAPRSPRRMLASGPAIAIDRSSTRYPSRTGMGAPFSLLAPRSAGLLVPVAADVVLRAGDQLAHQRGRAFRVVAG